MVEVIVQRAGLQTSLQDQGRRGYRQFGLPQGGAMDLQSAALANALLGNEEHLPVLEICLIGPRLLFQGSGTLVLTGADLSPQLNGRRLDLFRLFQVHAGDTLSFGKARSGCRAYLGVVDGWQAPSELGSCAPYLGGGLSFVQKDDRLYFSEQQTSLRQHARLRPPILDLQSQKLRAYPGPEWAFLDESQQALLLQQSYRILPESNRMGYRLAGTKALIVPQVELLSSMVLPGTVQLLPSGQPLILHRDAQTTGGYPRMLQLASADLNLLAQKVPGEEIWFEVVGELG